LGFIAIVGQKGSEEKRRGKVLTIAPDKRTKRGKRERERGRPRGIASDRSLTSNSMSTPASEKEKQTRKQEYFQRQHLEKRRNEGRLVGKKKNRREGGNTRDLRERRKELTSNRPSGPTLIVVGTEHPHAKTRNGGRGAFINFRTDATRGGH